MTQIKTALSANDEVYICDDNIKTYNFGYKSEKKLIKTIIWIMYITDLELLEYLFNDEKFYSFSELSKYAKMAHPKITQKIVNHFFINQQSIQMNNKEVGEKIF